MRSFESFKAKREQIDPSSRKLSDSQWQQAYAAYKRSRERVHGLSEVQGEPESASAESTKLPPAGMHVPSTVSATGQLRETVRADSAYSELRTIIDMLAWVVVGLIAIIAIGQAIAFGASLGALLAFGGGLLNLVLVFLFKMLIHVLIDIPDVALYRVMQERAHHTERMGVHNSAP